MVLQPKGFVDEAPRVTNSRARAKSKAHASKENLIVDETPILAPPQWNIGKTFLLGLGFFGVSVLWAIYNALVPVYLEKKFGLEPAVVGFFLTLDNIAALFIQPPVGAWSDKVRSPIGRRMPFILVGAPISALAFGLIPVAAALPLFSACTVTLVLSIAFWRTPSAALMPDVTPPQFRSQANGIINFMGGVGAIVAYFGSPVLARLNPAFPFWWASGLVLFVVAILLVFLREPKQAFEAEAAVPGLRESARELAKSRDKSALFFLFALACWMIGYSAIEGFWTLYCENHLRIGANRGTSLLGMMSLTFVLVALPVGYLGARIGRKKCMGTGLLMMAAILATMYFLPVATLNTPLFSIPVLGIVPVAGALLMCAGFAWALLIIHALPMIVDMTDASRAGTYTGWYYGFSALASIIGPIVNGLAVQFNGGNYNAVMIVAPVFMLLAFGLLMGVKRGDTRKVSPNVLKPD